MSVKLNKKFNILIIIVGIITVIISTIYNQKKDEEENKIEESNKNYFKNYMNNIEENNDKINSFFEEANANINLISDEPYVLEGFKYKEGEKNSGFVIEDDFENQYVWIPATVDDDNNYIKLQRADFDFAQSPIIDECLETSKDMKSFIESIKKYKGYYVARYEASKSENGEIISKPNEKPITKLTKETAENLSENIYSDSKIKTSLMNSYAWDTMVKWIEQTNNNKEFLTTYEEDEEKNDINANSSIKILNLKVKNTGEEKVNNIYDIYGNVAEITTEMCEETMVVRSAVDSEKKHIDMTSRILKLNNSDNEDTGFRIILYKE